MSIESSVPRLERLSAEGRFKELLGLIAPIAATGPLDDSPKIRLLEAQALQVTGAGQKALDVLGRVMSSKRTSPSLRSQCELVTGIEYHEREDYLKARIHFQNALNLAIEASDKSALGSAALWTLRTETKRFPSQSLGTRLREFRRWIVEAENPHLVAMLHVTLGRFEGKRGLQSHARRHFEIASELLSSFPNSYYAGYLEIDLCGFEGLMSNYSLCLKHARSAFKHASASGHTRARDLALSNIGLLNVWLGNVIDAEEHILRSLKTSSAYSEVQLNLLDTFAQLRFHQGDYAECERLLGEAWALAEERPESGWQFLGLTETTLRLARRQRAWERIESQLSRALDLARARRDPIMPVLLAFKVRATLESGSIEAASGIIEELLRRQGDGSLVSYAETESLLARIAAREGRTYAAHGHARRALDGCRATRNVCLIQETEHETRDALVRARPAAPTTEPAAHSDQASELLWRLGRVLELTATPELVGRELLQVLADAAPGLPARLVHANGAVATLASAGEATWPESPGDVRTIGLVPPWSETSPLRLEFVRLPTLQSLQAEASLRRIVGALRVIDDMAARSADREPLWPVEEPAEPDDGVFLSPKSLALVELARKYAASDLTILITGETGTGKEVLANLIHRASPREGRPFIPFNCSTVPRDLIDAHLFGYRKGAFTGAHESHSGLVRAASGGTLFLDEVGDLPLDVQPKLLRVLEHGEVLPLGETKPVRVDVRIIAATNVNLEEQVAGGRFRSDLFYRLFGGSLQSAPLRERREEIPALCQHFLGLYARDQKKKPPRLSEETMEYLLLFNWPGNIRQLSNEIRRIVVLAGPDELVGPDMLTNEIRQTRRTVPAGTVMPTSDSIVISASQALGSATEQLERALIARALEQADGRVEDAARALGLSRKGLYLKRRRLGFTD